jgi:hypothetical protein
MVKIKMFAYFALGTIDVNCPFLASSTFGLEKYVGREFPILITSRGMNTSEESLCSTSIILSVSPATK